ncbi:MAG: ABC transporter permease [Mycoplasmatales bacterium]|nr:ABC transporter permease [Mycoplasmatales bacterium]
MTSAEFNKEYNLQDINAKWFVIEEMKEKDDVQVVGKASTMTKDIFKRFFSNKWNWLFLTIIFVILMLTIIVPLTSRYSELGPISGTRGNDIRLLKPTWAGEQTKDFMISIPEWNNPDWVPKSGNVAGHWSWPKGAPNLPFDPANVGHDGVTVIKSTGQVRITVLNTMVNSHNLILGTDEVGRDVWTRLWIGTAWSLKLALLVAITETIIGVGIGVWIGFHVGKATDTIVMRIIEIFKSTPVLLWMILFATILGTGFWSIALVLILVGWTGPIWAARLFTLKVKDRDFILAAEVTGVSKFGRIYRHILPNIMGRLMVSFVLRVPAVIFFEATLIFLGMSVGAEGAATLGNLIQTGRSHILEQVYYVLGPVIVILLLTISLQNLANGLRDAFDPKISG